MQPHSWMPVSYTHLDVYKRQDQSYYFPQDGFDLEKDELIFNGIPLMMLIEKYGTPFKMTYLPKIGDQIKKAKNFFNRCV